MTPTKVFCIKCEFCKPHILTKDCLHPSNLRVAFVWGGLVPMSKLTQLNRSGDCKNFKAKPPTKLGWWDRLFPGNID